MIQMFLVPKEVQLGIILQKKIIVFQKVNQLKNFSIMKKKIRLILQDLSKNLKKILIFKKRNYKLILMEINQI